MCVAVEICFKLKSGGTFLQVFNITFLCFITLFFQAAISGFDKTSASRTIKNLKKKWGLLISEKQKVYMMK